MLKQESVVFDRCEDTIRYAKEVLGDPVIVVLPYETSQAIIVPNIDSLDSTPGIQTTLSGVFTINGESCALFSRGENFGRKPSRQKSAVHTTSVHRVPRIIHDGLILIMGRYGLHDETVEYYKEDDTVDLVICTGDARLETNPPRREYSPVFGQPCHRLPVTDKHLDELEKIMRDRFIPLSHGEKDYREGLREQTLALNNLAGLLIRMLPQTIDVEASLTANTGQKRSALEKLFTAYDL